MDDSNDKCKLGILSFSVNAQNAMTAEKAKRVAALVKGMNEYNCEYVGEAYIQIMEGKTKMYDGKDALRDLNMYAYFRKKEEEIELAKRAEVESRLINEVELEMGEAGAVAEMIEDKDLNVETIVADIGDKNYYVERYLEIREVLFFKKGVDIHRRLTLAMQGDKQAVWKTEWLFRECELLDFFREFFSVPEYWAEVCRILD
ncbi:hypothetical protein I6E39_05135 [Pseudoflavonifractor phocaeensis]|nr:hypothetical protein [Pseudoflavonifractor phocaeensis]